MLHAVPGTDPNYAGSPLYRTGKVDVENRIAQYENLAIWLAKDGKSPWLWVVPKNAKVSNKGGVSFFKCDETWVAVRPLGVNSLSVDGSLTARANEGKGSRFPEHVVLSSKGRNKKFCGMAIEVGEKQSHGSFTKFRDHVLAAELDESKLDEGVVVYRSRDGNALGFHWNDDPQQLGVWRNGKRHDWADHAQYLYRDYQDRSSPIQSKWGDGTLYVEAGGEAFRCSVDGDGRVTFRNGKPKEVRHRRQDTCSPVPVPLASRFSGRFFVRCQSAIMPSTCHALQYKRNRTSDA